MYSIEKIFHENKKMCNHILRLSKINNPKLWKKFGKPYISIYIGNNTKNPNHSFNLEWGNNKETVQVNFHYQEANKSLNQFKDEITKRINKLKKAGIYKK